MEILLKILKLLMNLFSWVFLGAFVLVLFFTAASNLNFLGNHKLLIVQSGSMEPTIMTGDVILISTLPQYGKNDVVTFQDTDGGITTHRIVEIKKIDNINKVSTKGDANRVQDSDLVNEDQIIGKVALIIPRLGYLINFIQSKVGTIIFLVVPAGIIVLDEIVHIFQAMKKNKLSRDS